MKCFICPRECGADREAGQTGFCGADDKIIVARVSLHMWEEPCISGKEGSGTVFFSGCNLRCIYCQNYEISHAELGKEKLGKEFTVLELSDAFIKLQNEGANNINLVTPTHYSLQIKDAVSVAKKNGLSIPIIYNCSGYEKVETLKMLEGTVDIYLTDFKYMNDSLGKDFSLVGNYSDVAKLALEEMVRQHPEPLFDSNGMMTEGVIVRNLLLPGNVKNSRDVIEYVYRKYGDKVFLSVMNQYTPLSQVEDIALLNRKVTKREYERLTNYMFELGIDNAYIQEGDVAKESFIPAFDWGRS